jgi:hypothetical protein
MQSPSLEDTRKGVSLDLPPADASHLLDLLRAAQVSVVPPTGLGIHSTTYTLRVSSFASQLTLVWLDALPLQWAGIEALVAKLELLTSKFAADT